MQKTRITLSIIRVLLVMLLRPIKMVIWAKFFSRGIYINAWFGELGNNLIQITHAEYLAEKTDRTIYLPQHRFLKLEQTYQIHETVPAVSQNVDPSTSGLFLTDLQSQPEDGIHLKGALFRGFYYDYDLFPLRPSLMDYRRILQTKVLPLIPHGVSHAVTDETLVIHIRSGDVFQRKPHPAYVQPPLSFYLKIIEESNFQDILIVTQGDFKNPCIQQLKQLIPTVRIQASTLSEDISAILSAKNLVAAFSTFSIALAFASEQIQRLYLPQLEVKEDYWRTLFWPPIFKLAFLLDDGDDATADATAVELLDFDLRLVKVYNYLSIGDWKNNQAQRDLMLNHMCEQVVFSRTDK